MSVSRPHAAPAWPAPMRRSSTHAPHRAGIESIASAAFTDRIGCNIAFES
jgi:hypothetical protein